MSDRATVTARQEASGGGRLPYGIAVVFIVLTVVLLADPLRYRSPVRPVQPVPAWVVSTATVRHPSPRPEIQVAVYTYRCSECHNLFPSPSETLRPLTQHRDIVLKHGLNDRCFNCHHPRQRDAFVDDMGQPIPWDDPPRLCGKCHGPVYRDWLHGVHGRTNGYWDTTRGPSDRRKCVECHDPHAPAFPPMVPAPGPHTPRMGRQEGGHIHEDSKNPLLIYRQIVTDPSEAGEAGGLR